MFRTNIQAVGGRNLSLSDLRLVAMNEPEAFMRKIQAGIDSDKLGIADISDWKELHRAFADVEIPVHANFGGSVRAITTSAFPILTGALAMAQITKSYESVESIGGELVTEMNDPKSVTHLTVLNSLGSSVDEVKELENFPEVGVSEESISIRSRLNGRKLSFSAQAIQENNATDIVRRTNQLGLEAAEIIEELTLKRVTDYDGSKASPDTGESVYRPNNTATALFSATANTPGTRAPSGNRVNSNALVDDTDLETARIRLATMLNARSKRIQVPMGERILLVPDALVGTALNIINSEMTPGVANQVSAWGPKGQWRTRVLSSPKMDDLSASAWYYGAFKRQFIRKQAFTMEFVNLGMNTQAYLDSMLAVQFRVAWNINVGAEDYVNVIQNIDGTTAPADE